MTTNYIRTACRQRGAPGTRPFLLSASQVTATSEGTEGAAHSQGVVGHHDFTSAAAVVPHQNAQLGLGTLHRCSRRGAEAGPTALGDLPLKDSCPPQADVPAQENAAQPWERWQAPLDRRRACNNINGWLPACLVHAIGSSVCTKASPIMVMPQPQTLALASPLCPAS